MKPLVYHHNNAGYLEASQDAYILSFGKYVDKPENPFLLEIVYSSTVIRSNWVTVFTLKKAKQEMRKEYLRIRKIFRKESPLTQDCYVKSKIYPQG